MDGGILRIEVPSELFLAALWTTKTTCTRACFPNAQVSKKVTAVLCIGPTNPSSIWGYICALIVHDSPSFCKANVDQMCFCWAKTGRNKPATATTNHSTTHLRHLFVHWLPYLVYPPKHTEQDFSTQPQCNVFNPGSQSHFHPSPCPP